MIVEVFKTNVNNRDHANTLLALIHKNFAGYKANFDLQDCDKILRVLCTTGAVATASLINLLSDAGFDAELLPDDLPPVSRLTAIQYPLYE